MHFTLFITNDYLFENIYIIWKDNQYMTFHEGYMAVGSIATAIIAIIIFVQIYLLTRQTNELKRTNELAHSPRIVPRQMQSSTTDSVAIMSIQNVGTASAINIDITLKSKTDSQPVRLIALIPMQAYQEMSKNLIIKERIPIPLLTAKKGDMIEIIGTYENVKGEKKDINDKFSVNEIAPYGTESL